MSTRGQDSTDDPTYKLGSSLNRSYLTPPARSSPRLQQLNYEDDIDDFDNTFVDENGSGNENGISNGISNENTDANADWTRDMRLSFWHQFVTNWLIMDPVLLEKYKSRSNRVRKKRYKNNFVKNYKLNSNAETSKFFYFFGARLQTTKAKPINVITVVLIIVPLVIYCVFEAKWQWHNVLPAVVIVFIYLWLLTFMNFCKAAMSDPGILPRNIHLPKTLESGKIINPPEEYFNTVTLPTFSKSSGMNGNVDKVSVNNNNANNNNTNNNNNSNSNNIGNNNGDSNTTATTTLGVQVKYCQTCHIWRPARTSHCSTCQVCVLSHDHHCVFLNNCVGERNYKYFLWFLLLACITCCYLIIVSIVQLCYYRIGRVDEIHDWFLSIGHFPLSLFLAVYGIVALIYPLLLLVFHIYLSSQNITTREYLNYVYRRKHEIFVNAFDTHSMIKNLYINWVGKSGGVGLSGIRDVYIEGDYRFAEVKPLQTFAIG